MSQKYRPSLSQTIGAQTPLEFGDGQLELEDIINHSKRSEAERERFGKLAATPQQSAKRDQLAKGGNLGTTAKVGYVEQISAYAAKQREKSQRKNAKADTAPTPERLAKLMDRGDASEISPPIRDTDTRAITKAHTIAAPIDKYGKHWDVRLEQAARDIRNIFLIAESGYQRVTGTYDGTPAGVAGPRHGGVQDHIRECQAMAELIKAKFPAVMREVEWFLTQTVVKNGTGEAMKFEDAGALISPWKSEEAKKGIGFGLFYRSIEVLAPFLAEERAKGFGAGVASTEAARALNMEMRARAMIVRERAEKERKRKEQQQPQKGGR